MKAPRFNFYRTGMEPEGSGDWVRASDLPKEIRDRYVQDHTHRKGDESSEDDDE